MRSEKYFSKQNNLNGTRKFSDETIFFCFKTAFLVLKVVWVLLVPNDEKNCRKKLKTTLNITFNKKKSVNWSIVHGLKHSLI